MKIVIDTNRIIAALIKESTTRDLLFNNNFQYTTPEYTTTELKKHEKELQTKTKLNSKEYNILLTLIHRNNPPDRIPTTH